MSLNLILLSRGVRIGVAVFCIFIAVKHVLIPTLVDEFRQRLFRLRRQAFLFMADGGIESTDPSYIALCTSINGLIKFADGLSLGRMIMAFMFGGPAEDDTWRTDKRLHLIYVKLGYEIIRYAILRSPLAWWILVFALPILHVYRLLRPNQPTAWATLSASVATKRPIRQIEADAGARFIACREAA